MNVKIAPRGCPVCGFPDFDALESGRSVTYEICPSCGCESGYEYDEEVDAEHLAALRRDWFVAKKGVWWSSSKNAPTGWAARDQLIRANLEVPVA